MVKVYKVLSDESRLRALNLLLEKECCVCEVMQAMEISQSKASRILSALCDVGFLKMRKDGLWSLYSINWDGMDAHLREILEATKRTFIGNKQMEVDCERIKAAKRIGPSYVNKVRQKQLSPKASQS